MHEIAPSIAKHWPY